MTGTDAAGPSAASAGSANTGQAGPRVGLIGSHLAPFAAACDLVGWHPAALAGGAAELVNNIAAPAIDLDVAVAAQPLDIAILATPHERRIGDAQELLARGVHVLLVPDIDLPDVAALTAPDSGPAMLALAAPLIAAPTTGQWLSRVGEASGIEHLAGRAGPPSGPAGPLRGQLLALMTLAARAAGWDQPSGVRRDGADVVLQFSSSNRTARATSTPAVESATFTVQAAGPADAIVLDALPDTQVEHNGTVVASARPDEHPAVRFGTAPLLRRFVADLRTRRPLLDGALLTRLTVTP
ncbi:MAG: hypothetical protein AAFY28_15795 [Actinomycetota bacterium]